MKNVTSSNFEQEVMQNDDSVVLVDFWAEWCGPCKALGPVLEAVEKEMAGTKSKIVKVNVDEASDLAQKYGIRGIPTLIYFKNGQVKSVSVGNQSKEEIVKTLKSHG
jgi:thioredoxin 1